ncbi:glucose-methanol-choline oxidoreductase [Cavenderia fasciculata]|uniref:Glucose-methanol-choline oxidoreductase n=1 Tax=Cavenderia fasciculata TaxID=261658 RepID=F4PKZ7_CACFS|nr:glucose-methanol-choline oxidoreductase [Cavenderia fasciculata]EGG23219.1 glucose-methanol-choline oxidoreductase [Cavenderia fasciculata]|eukprot:XP_004361070.1 glucose-methanol-choline oxidoreductase [Cavenderia fasciculata]
MNLLFDIYSSNNNNNNSSIISTINHFISSLSSSLSVSISTSSSSTSFENQPIVPLVTLLLGTFLFIVCIFIILFKMSDTPVSEVATQQLQQQQLQQQKQQYSNGDNNINHMNTVDLASQHQLDDARTTNTLPKNPTTSHLHMESGGIFTMKDIIGSDDDIEAIINSIDPNDQRKLTLAKEYFSRKASDLDIPTLFLRLVVSKTRTQIDDLKKLLYLMSSSGPGFILTGTFSSFTSLSFEKRQKILAMMKTSVNPLRRQAYRAVAPLTCSLFLMSLNSNGVNPNWELLDYPLPPPPEQIPTKERLSFINISSEQSLKTDVVVIGSGAGGGVTAAILAEAGYNVIILEKGSYLSPNAMTWKEAEAYPLLYEQAASLVSEDISVNVLAGSCVGGGTTVNWAASIKTPEHVLDDWRKDCPNTFEKISFNDALDKVSARLNVNKNESVHNKPNDILQRALDELNYDSDVIARNVKGCDTSQCGYCSMGCRSRSKQSSMITYLEDACLNGAKIIVHCEAMEITSTVPKGGQVPTSPTAHGVVAIVTHPDGERHRVFIKCDIIVSSAGAIHTPALLLRSGLSNPNIGKTLYLHPVLPAVGIFEKEAVEIWKGVPMSVISREFQGKYGTILETPNAHLGVVSMIVSYLWDSSSMLKEHLYNVKTWSCIIPILRDKNPGKIKLDKDHRSPKIVYNLSDEDYKNLLPGVEGAIRALVAAGAKKFSVPIAGTTIVDSENLESYIKNLKSTKYKPNKQAVLSAHQMGSCRMGSNKNNSVVNENGESWDMKKLFIADGSVLPSAVGVNPMITIYAVSYQIAQSILKLYPPPSKDNIAKINNTTNNNMNMNINTTDIATTSTTTTSTSTTTTTNSSPLNNKPGRKNSGDVAGGGSIEITYEISENDISNNNVVDLPISRTQE